MRRFLNRIFCGFWHKHRFLIRWESDDEGWLVGRCERCGTVMDEDPIWPRK